VCVSGVKSQVVLHRPYRTKNLPWGLVHKLDVPRQHPTDVTEGCADKGKEDNQDRFLQVQDNLLQWIESLSDLSVTTADLPQSGPEELSSPFSLSQSQRVQALCTSVENIACLLEGWWWELEFR
jgi:hypothetical protein